MSDELDDFTAQLNSGEEQPATTPSQPRQGGPPQGGPPGPRGPGGQPPQMTP